MGGGDLNLKKSWHPNTMKNQERVWKAEQKDSEEKKRIAELQRELNAERSKEDLQKFAEDSGCVKKKDDTKLEWMYKGPRQMVNNEDYLLGKAVDKSFEKYQLEQRSLASASYGGSNDEPVDMARKLVEDPLIAIRRRAVEKAKELYNNPIKLKQIQKLATLQSTKNSKSPKKKKKKQKKSHKNEGSNSDQIKNLDALLTAKLKKVLKDKDILMQLKKQADGSSSDSDSSSSGSGGSDCRRKEVQPNSDKDGRRKMGFENYDKSRKTHGNMKDFHPDNDSISHKKDQSNHDGAATSIGSGDPRKTVHSKGHRGQREEHVPSKSTDVAKFRRDFSSSSGSETECRKYDSDEDIPKRKRMFGLMMADGSKPVVKPLPLVKKCEEKPQTQKQALWKRKEKVKLTEEEMERRRKEMVANADWRDKEREENVKRSRLEDDRERKQHEKDFDKDFARKQFSKATEYLSVEERIKSKVNNIQRTKLAMDRNFARR